jgi:hypothetical protein
MLAIGAPQPLRERMRSGLLLLWDAPGEGELVQRQQSYRLRLRLWLHGGDPVRWTAAWGPVGDAHLDDDRATLITVARIDRHALFNGLFYDVEGMRVGGTRKLEVAPSRAAARSV